MVASYDFFPTILDYLGVPAHRDPKFAGRFKLTEQEKQDLVEYLKSL